MLDTKKVGGGWRGQRLFELPTLPLRRTARSSPCQVAESDKQEPGSARKERNVEVWDPPGGDEHAQQSNEAEERAPRAWWGESEDAFASLSGSAAKSQMRCQD